MDRGFIFSTDGALAFTVTAAVIVASSFYIQDANRSGWYDVNLIRVTYDIGLALDRAGVLSSNNDTLIEESLNRTKPSNMLASAEIERYYLVNGTLERMSGRIYGDVIPEDYATGQVISIDDNGGYYRTRLKVGLR